MNKLKILLFIGVIFYAISITLAGNILIAKSFIEKKDFRDVSYWFIEKGFPEFYKGLTEDELKDRIKERLTKTYFSKVEIAIEENNYLAIMLLHGISRNQYAAYCFKREEIKGTIYEFWALQTFINSGSGTCEFLITKSNGLKSEREIVEEKKRYFKYYETPNREKIVFPTDNKTLYRLAIWLFPETYKGTDLDGIKIIYNENKEYEKIDINRPPKKNYEWILQFGTKDSEEWKDVIIDNKGNLILFEESVNYDNSYRKYVLKSYDANRNLVGEKDIEKIYFYNGLLELNYIDNKTGDYYFSKICVPGVNGSYSYVIKKNQKFLDVWKKALKAYIYVFSMDNDNFLYLGGRTKKTLVEKYENKGNDDIVFMKMSNENGDIIWNKQFGSKEIDTCQAICDNSNNLYLVASMGDFENFKLYPGKFNSSDIYLMKFDSEGNRKWIKQTGTNHIEYLRGIKIDSLGNIYILAETNEKYFAVNSQVLLIKFDKDGKELWKRIFDTPLWDIPCCMVIDNNNNIYITGKTTGTFSGNINRGEFDVFLIKLDSNGNRIWVKMVGSRRDDYPQNIAYDGKDGIYVCGYTESSLPGFKNKGDFDGFLIKFSTNP